ncbi:homoaconitase/3-isopropylmalate dehydratase large subunit [Cohnella lubricantis]|nr:homoaconitase/3-isopropylmalate dehydratase large subunit [Cohnella lubricantis]
MLRATKALLVPCCGRAQLAAGNQGTLGALLRAGAASCGQSRHFWCLVADRHSLLRATKALLVPCCGRAQLAAGNQGTFGALLRTGAACSEQPRHFWCLVAGGRSLQPAIKALLVPCCGPTQLAASSQGTFSALVRAGAACSGQPRHFWCLVADRLSLLRATKALLVPCCGRAQLAAGSQGTFGALLRAGAACSGQSRHFWCLVADRRSLQRAVKALLVPCCGPAQLAAGNQGTLGALLRTGTACSGQPRHF